MGIVAGVSGKDPVEEPVGPVEIAKAKLDAREEIVIVSSPFAGV